MLGPLRFGDILHVEPLLVTQGHEVPVAQLLTNLLLKCHKEGTVYSKSLNNDS